MCRATASTLFTQTVGSTTYNAAIATETGGRNVHFSTDAVMADNNLLWQAIDWAALGEAVSVGLQMSRQTSIVASRNDMDQSQEAEDVNPPGNAQGIYDKLIPILQEWKDLYNFVGSYYVNVGNYGPEQQTNWAISGPYYQQMLAMGNEIGSHSYTHPHDTNYLFADVVTQEAFDAAVAHYQSVLGTSDIVYSPYALHDDANPTVLAELAGLTLAQLNQRLAAALAAPNPATLSEADKAILETSYTFQFARAKAVIETQLGISIDGAAVPGAPEKFDASLAILPLYNYLSGGYSGAGAGYPGAFGYFTPDMQDHVYLAPNMSFDFTLVDWQNKTPAQALAAWLAEFAALTSHADVPVIMWPWHDYGPTEWMVNDGQASTYTKQMFADFIAAAYNAGAEFVTSADLAKRISAFEKSSVTFSQTGNVITATVTSTDAGKFALDLDHLGSQQIVSVTGWYAYDSDSVFLPRNGGTYAISLGAAPVDVTHIITLPSRAELVSLTGDGRSLNFTIIGEGKLVIDLKNPAGRTLDVQGATIVSQAGDLLTLDIGANGSHTVTVTLNATPVITSDGGGASASVSVAENTTAVASVAASDLDAPDQTITYSIAGGADAALFTVNASTGALSFINAPNFEAAGDAGANNVYDVVVRASDGIVHDEQAIAVTVTNVNEAPEIAGGATANASMAENGTAATTISASDPDSGTTITYSVTGGADAALFAIDPNTGVLSFLAAPNFEAPADAGANNVYDVVVLASDGSLHDEQTVAITVTDANDAPVISSHGGGSAASVSIAENTTAVATVAASDVDAGATITYSISGGADAALFAIDANTGALTFIAPPNFEAPADAGADNVYDVIVRASDGTLHDEQALAVTITDANEAPVIASNGGGATGGVNVAENSTTVTTVVAADPDAGAVITYSIAGGADAALFAIDANTGALTFIAPPNFEAPSDAGTDNIYDVVVRASDGALFDEQALAVTATAANDAPVITSDGGGATGAVSVGENTTAVTNVVATDVDVGATITYSITGGADAALFAIDANTGALSFIAPPNFEAPGDVGANSIYDVIVRASDGTLHDEQALAVTITDANDAPGITSNGGDATGAVSVAENGSIVTTVVAADPDAGAVITYSLAGGVDAALFAIDANTGALTFIVPPNFEAPGDVGADNIYDVVVRASDGTLFDEQTLAVTVTAANDAPVIASNGGGATGVVSVGENSTAVTTVAATDADVGAVITYSIAGGPDAALFAIDANTGALTFIAAPNFEAPADAGADNVYDVIVRASDGVAHDEQALAVTVTDANDAPEITSNGAAATGAASVAENTTAVTTVVAADVDTGAVLTYSITGGADAALFAIDANTGVLTFIAAPDFELPGDAGADNVYDVVVHASDGTLFDEQALAVTVTNVADAVPVITSHAGAASVALTMAENIAAVSTVTASDADVGQAIAYSISGGADAALFTVDSVTGALAFAAAPNFEAPGDAGANNVYDVVVRATDAAGLFDEQAFALTTTDDWERQTGTAGADILIGTANANLIDGAGGDDQITGGAAADQLLGGAGADTIRGEGGADMIDGGADADVIYGGLGDDTFIADRPDDQAIENANEGVDTVVARGDYTLTKTLIMSPIWLASRGGGKQVHSHLSSKPCGKGNKGQGGRDIYRHGLRSTFDCRKTIQCDTTDSVGVLVLLEPGGRL